MIKSSGKTKQAAELRSLLCLATHTVVRKFLNRIPSYLQCQLS